MNGQRTIGLKAAMIGTRVTKNVMQLDADLQLINEEFHAENVTSPQLDLLLADGWRHFGTHFFVIISAFMRMKFDACFRFVLDLKTSNSPKANAVFCAATMI